MKECFSLTLLHEGHLKVRTLIVILIGSKVPCFCTTAPLPRGQPRGSIRGSGGLEVLARAPVRLAQSGRRRITIVLLHMVVLEIVFGFSL